ncbi:hypothetical protein MLD52_21850 [Puniceicoccaceae bacterium K14]|nr:hypothetical protein [Puniceicoccaceae bacterium K14]
MSTRIKILFLIMGFSLNSLFGESDSMTGKGLEEILREISGDNIAANGNVIEFEFQEILLVCVFDESHNRMRIISPIKKYEDVSNFEKNRMMEANFHTALDARYCVSDGVLYSAYIHPLSSLKKTDVLSGIYQTASLHVSFGSDYSSGIFTFGEEPDDKDMI